MAFAKTKQLLLSKHTMLAILCKPEQISDLARIVDQMVPFNAVGCRLENKVKEYFALLHQPDPSSQKMYEDETQQFYEGVLDIVTLMRKEESKGMDTTKCLFLNVFSQQP
jgi:hypothetical protein